MVTITREDVDRYFKERPLKKLFLKRKGLFEEYYNNCLTHYCRDGHNHVNYPGIDSLSSPFIWRDTTRGMYWQCIELEFKQFKIPKDEF